MLPVADLQLTLTVDALEARHVQVLSYTLQGQQMLQGLLRANPPASTDHANATT
jgi:hypothetical protein